MSDLMNEIKDKVVGHLTNLQKELQEKTAYLKAITDNVEKMLADKGTLITSINVINGAIQAFQESHRLLAPTTIENVVSDIETITSVAEDVSNSASTSGATKPNVTT